MYSAQIYLVPRSQRVLWHGALSTYSLSLIYTKIINTNLVIYTIYVASGFGSGVR